MFEWKSRWKALGVERTTTLEREEEKQRTLRRATRDYAVLNEGIVKSSNQETS
jgi:hypothetical protein